MISSMEIDDELMEVLLAQTFTNDQDLLDAENAVNPDDMTPHATLHNTIDIQDEEDADDIILMGILENESEYHATNIKGEKISTRKLCADTKDKDEFPTHRSEKN